MKYNLDITSIALAAILAFILFTDQPVTCHTFAPTDSSHIRLNQCTGEAHIIVRGTEGFEWRAVR